MVKLSRLLAALPLFIAVLFAPLHPTVSAQACPEPRLTIGGQGQVTPGAANRVRNAPTTSAERVGEIPAESIFTVLEGPECADGFLWWRVDFKGLIGWTVEGNAEGYFVEPVNPDSVQATATAAPAGESTCLLAPRLEIGREGKPTTNTPSRLRDQPGVNGAQVGLIDPLDTFLILDGPVCADGINWWRVDASGAVGWTAEGTDGEYFVELLALVPTATPAYIGLPEPVNVAWSADGVTLAVGTAQGVFLYVSTDFNATPDQFLGASEILSVDFHPTDLRRLAVTQYIDENFSTAFYDLTTKTIDQLIVSERPVRPASPLSFTADGTIFAYDDGGIPTVRDLATGDYLFSPQLPDWSNGEVAYMGSFAVVISSDGALLGIDDGRLRLLPVGGSLDQLVEFDRDVLSDNAIHALSFSPDGQQLLIGDSGGNLQMWDVSTGERTSFVRGQRSTSSNIVNDLVFTPDGNMVITAESDPHAVVRVFNAQTLQQVNALNFGVSTQRAVALALSPDGTTLAVVVDDTVRILEVATLTEVAQLVLQRNE